MSSTLSIFSSFKKLGFSFFQSNSEEDVVTVEKNKLDQEVDSYLKNKMVELVLIYMGSGYKLNKNQNAKFLENLDATNSDEMIKIFTRVLDKGVEISDTLLVYTFFPLAETLARNERYNGSNPVYSLFYKKINDETFTNRIYDMWLENVNFVLVQKPSRLSRDKIFRGGDSFTRQRIITPFEYFGKVMFKNKKLEDFSLIMEKTKQLINKYEIVRRKAGSTPNELWQLQRMLDPIATYSSTHCGNEIAEKQKKIGILYDGGELEKLVAAENIKLSNNNDIKNLPGSAKNHLENIKKDYLSLNKKLDDLTEEERFNINNLWNKRIPEIINKYLRADPEFRTTMKDVNGKTIEDLLNDSLGHIHEVLKQIQQSHTETTLKEMSALNKYAKALR